MPALYHTHPEQTDFTAQVVSCEAVPGKENLWRVVLSDTAFYPTGGGQPCDAGTLNGCEVTDVTHDGDDAPIVHFVRSVQPLSGEVTGHIDAQRRLDHTQQHSGQHLISHVLYERFGAYSLGLHVGAQDSYVDLTDDGSWEMTRRIADEAEQEIAQWIARNEPVRCFFPTAKELEQLPLRKKPDPHEALRIVCIGSEEAVACCGTHVATTGQVQAVRILSWQQSHGNLRIFFVAGLRALNYARVRIEQADAAAKQLSCNVSDLAAAVERLKTQTAELSHALAELRREQTVQKLSALEPLNAPCGPLYAAQLDGADTDALKDGLNLLTRREGAVCFLCAEQPGGGYSVALGVGEGSPIRAGDALRKLLPLLDGKGGGRPDSAFGRCARMDLDLVKKTLSEL